MRETSSTATENSMPTQAPHQHRETLHQHGLVGHTAQVALCLDISGSMSRRYRDGAVAALTEQALALATAFGQTHVEVFPFGEHGHHAGSATPDTHADFVSGLLTKFPLEPGTDYGAAMSLVRQHYFADADTRRTPRPGTAPIYVLFLTDGQTTNEEAAREQLISSSYEPLFWQFVALGRSTRSVTPGGSTRAPSPGVSVQRRATPAGPVCGGSGNSEFRFLDELDDCAGRYLDNSDFFGTDDPTELPDSRLFALLVQHYPRWLADARHQGLLQQDLVR